MRILVISDIHANLTALEAVLQSAGSFDAAWCLGDLVGYGPDPNECVERVRALPNLACVRGNHDDAVSSTGDLEEFNDDARRAALMTRRLITPENMSYLKSLPGTEEREAVTLAHGSPRNPVWEYILEKSTARQNFSCFRTNCAIVGHTHFPMIFALDADEHKVHAFVPLPDVPVTLAGRTILNPGSVGQPRDNDPRASYALLDPGSMTWELRRVRYDVSAVQERIRQKGLPARGADRLADGW
jgi:predicted phosphodiesterase